MDAEWIRPDISDREKVILYLHGGGYALGSSHTHRSFVGQLTKDSGMTALMAIYRKIPECKFPAALDDAKAAYDYLINQGYLPQNIVFAGDSAGGGLCLSLLQKLRNENLPLPCACVLLSPWTDLAVTGQNVEKNVVNDPLVRVDKMKEWGKIYAGKYELTNPLISPLYANLSGLPPMLIQVSNSEALWDDSKRLHEAALKAGVNVVFQEFDDLMHWWHIFWQLLPESKDSITKISAFLKEHVFIHAEQQSVVG